MFGASISVTYVDRRLGLGMEPLHRRGAERRTGDHGKSQSDMDDS